MFLYYLRLSALSYRRNPVLSSLMVLAVAIGVGAYMVVYTLNYFMGGDPIPQKSSVLYHLQIDSGNPDDTFEPPSQLTWLDATALLNADNNYRQTASSKFNAVVEPEGDGARPFSINGRGNFGDFFPMFDAHFLYGGGWDRGADEGNQQVIVLSRELNDRLFGGVNSVGQTVNLQGNRFEITGVLDNWQPFPKFYDVNNGPFDSIEDAFVPWNLITSLPLSRGGNTNCWKAPVGTGLQAFLNSECVWIQYWIELPSTQDRENYLDFLDNYTRQQQELGRLLRPVNNGLFNVNQWLVREEVLPQETQILAALAAMLLAVCLLNTVGLLLSKFLGKSGEIGLRQALGAHKGSLFTQHLVEAGFIGLIGGLLGLGVAKLGLWGIEGLIGDLMTTDWMQLNPVLITVTLLLSVGSTIVAGLYPIWRACNVNPAIHLKTQ
ncbi:MAG: ABC transporter permease [Pseudohongiellaceae bacterium]